MTLLSPQNFRLKVSCLCMFLCASDRDTITKLGMHVDLVKRHFEFQYELSVSHFWNPNV